MQTYWLFVIIYRSLKNLTSTTKVISYERVIHAKISYMIRVIYFLFYLFKIENSVCFIKLIKSGVFHDWVRSRSWYILSSARSWLFIKRSDIKCLMVSAVPQVWQCPIGSMFRTASLLSDRPAGLSIGGHLFWPLLNSVFWTSRILRNLFFVRYSFVNFFESSYDIRFVSNVKRVITILLSFDATMFRPASRHTFFISLWYLRD